MEEKEEKTPRLYILVSCPRTASSLAVKVFNPEEQPNIQKPNNNGGFYSASGGSFFLPVVQRVTELKLHGKPVPEWTEIERALIKTTYHECFGRFVKYTIDAQSARKNAFANEHASFFFGSPGLAEVAYPGKKDTEQVWMNKYSGGMQGTRSVLNNTFMPDEFLNITHPIFLIRHPAVSFPSFERQMLALPSKGWVSAEERNIAMTYSFTRSLYSYYSNHYAKNPSKDGVKWPLVIDADDMINHQDLLLDIGELMHLQRTKMQFKWDKKTPKQLAELPVAMTTMMGTLNASTGIQTDQHRCRGEEVEGGVWRVFWSRD
jgi:hypothetical protein